MFAPAMVRAILDGRKTQTRRLIAFADPDRPRLLTTRLVDNSGPDARFEAIFGDSIPDDPVPIYERCPFGVPGDRLWVREMWRTGVSLDMHNATQIAASARDAGWSKPWAPLLYTADESRDNADTLRNFGGAWGRVRSARFMPRWASRLLLTVSAIRVERLNEITEEDARAEGCEEIMGQDFWTCWCRSTGDSFDMTVEPSAAYRTKHGITEVVHHPAHVRLAPRENFVRLWQNINGKRPDASWKSNPWVWVVSFERVAMERAA